MHSLSINCRVLICCTCHFQGGSPLFILDSSVCKYLQYLISALTREGKSGHLFRLTCSVVLWRWAPQTNTTGMCGEWSHWMDHSGFATAQGGVYLPGPSCSGNWVLGERTVPGGLWSLMHLPIPGCCFRGVPWGHSPRCAVCLLWGADLRLWYSWQM